MERNYLAYCDNGHEFINFEFTSEHRANSKANKIDCINQFKRKKGNQQIKVLSTSLYN